MISNSECDEKVKVRIAVSVDADGRWVAYGCSEDDDQEAQNFTVASMAPGQTTYFVTVAVPKPSRLELVTDLVDRARGM